jgi:ABC-type glutathione transport system ATPase component
MATAAAPTCSRSRNLSLAFRTPRGRLRALRNVSVDIPRKRIVGIVGESGCGKSTLISTIMRLLPANAEITGGEHPVRRREPLERKARRHAAAARRAHLDDLPGPDDRAQSRSSPSAGR